MSLVYNEIVPPTTGDKEELDRWYEEVSERLKTYDGDIQTAATSGGGGGPSDAPFIVDPTIPTPTTVTSFGAFGTIIINWDEASYTGHSYAEIFYSLTDDIQTAIKIGDTTSSTYTHTSPDLDTTVFNYYWVRFVNKNFEVGLFSVSTGSTVTDDPAYVLEIVKDSIGFQHMAPGEWPVRTEDPLPLLPDANYPIGCLVILLSDGKLYRNVANVWTAAVEWVDVANVSVTGSHIAANTISAGNIAANAISSSELQADAVVAGKIAAGALVVDDGVMQNAYIGTAHIKDLAITSAKIASLDAGKISAGTITGSTLQTSGSGKRFKVSNNHEAYMYDFDNTILVSLGILTDGGDTTCSTFGATNRNYNAIKARSAGNRPTIDITNAGDGTGLNVVGSGDSYAATTAFITNNGGSQALEARNNSTGDETLWVENDGTTGRGGYIGAGSTALTVSSVSGSGVLAYGQSDHGLKAYGKTTSDASAAGVYSQGYHGIWIKGYGHGIICETESGAANGIIQRPRSGQTAPTIGINAQGASYDIKCNTSRNGGAGLKLAPGTVATPTWVAEKGSLFMSSAATLWVNNNGSNGWTQL